MTTLGRANLNGFRWWGERTDGSHVGTDACGLSQTFYFLHRITLPGCLVVSYLLYYFILFFLFFSGQGRETAGRGETAGKTGGEKGKRRDMNEAEGVQGRCMTWYTLLYRTDTGGAQYDCLQTFLSCTRGRPIIINMR